MTVMWAVAAMCLGVGYQAWGETSQPVARYLFTDAADLGRDAVGDRHMLSSGGRAGTGPAGPAAVFSGEGGLSLPAEACPAFRSGFGLDLWLRVDDLTGPMLVTGRDGQFLLRVDPLKESGRLSLFVHGDTWEPRLRGPRLRVAQWYHVRAGWDGRQMALHVGDSSALQQRRVRLPPTQAPFVVGRGLQWGAPLRGAVSAVQVIVPAPSSWFRPEPVVRLAGSELVVFEVTDAYPRASRPERVRLRFQADRRCPAGRVSLTPDPGLRLLSEPTQRLRALNPGESATVTWRVQATAPGAYKACVSDEVQGAVERSFTFHPNVSAERHDYVPAPNPVHTDVLVGAHMCPLWKEGTRRAVWRPIVPWFNRKPVLGWYDEGDPAVADWEITWCLDHGISFFVYCWYREGQGGAVRQKLGHAIHDGLFHARYGDRFRFAIMWENQQKGWAGVASETDLLENLLPFWLENYFTHPSYLVLDGKPLLYIYRPEYLIRDLGSTAQVRQALGKARAACRAAGFEGLTLLGEYRGNDRAHLQRLVDLGMDCSFAYCWPLPGSPPSAQAVGMQEARWRERREQAVLPEMITVSMGWDSRPWHPSSSVWRLTPDDFQDACERALAVAKEYPAGSLSRRVILLDNWNEFGEGHYIAPHRQHGFGYLDAARAAFAPAAAEAHIDLTPADVGLGSYETRYRHARAEAERVLRQLTAKPEELVTDDGLLACWTFDYLTGSDVALDATGHGLGVRLHGATCVTGRRGQALVCDGASAKTAPDPRLFPERLTVSCWVRTETAEQVDRWFINSVYGGTTDSGYRLGLTGRGRLCWGVPETSWSHHLTADAVLPLGRWVHVAATADSSVMRIYMDGREVARMDRSVPVGTPVGRTLTLGNYEQGHRAHFVGLLDEVQIYDHVLTPEQIAALAR